MVVAGPAFDLPGIRFEAQPPPPPEVLPHMDVAGFVGLAARGPLHTPVAVDDLAGFTAVFGGDLVLGIDPDDGAEVTAHLRPSVAAFFRNGGRRCWIVRVAGVGATPVTFQLPGVLACTPGAGARAVDLARVRASSVGGWAADLAVGIGIEALGLDVWGVVRAPGAAGPGSRVTALRVGPRGDLERGDVLRLARSDATLVFVVVDAVRPAPLAGGSAGRAGERLVDLGACEAFRPTVPERGLQGRARCWIGGTELAATATALPPVEGQEPGDAALELDLRPAQQPSAGSWIRFAAGNVTWWVVVDAVRTSHEGPEPRIVVTGPAFRHLGRAAARLAGWAEEIAPAGSDAGSPAGDGDEPGPRARIMRLRASLASGAGALTEVVPDLGLAPGHARFVGDLPADERRFGPDPARPWDATLARLAAAGTRPRQLAGLAGEGFLVPLAVEEVPRWLAGPDDPGADRDRLGPEHAIAFADPALASVDAARLVAEADFIRYQAASPRTLCGIHALLDVDEVTLLAVPDLARPGWSSTDHGRPRTPPLVAEPGSSSTFDLCDPGAPASPEPRLEWLGDGHGFRIAWPRVRYATGYEVQIASEPATWAPPRLVERKRTRYQEGDPRPGTRRFRVRSVNANGSSAWSPSIRVAVGPALLARPDVPTDLAALVRDQAAVVRLCAARGDVFAILSLPRELPVTESLDYLARLRTEVLVPGAPPDARLTGPEADALNVLSYAALYHPWIVTVADPAAAGIARAREALPLGSPADRVSSPRSRPTAIGVPRALPPDGPIAGTYAARARDRGAWVAAASSALRDAVAIDRPADESDLPRLHAGGLNVVRRTPAGFLVLANHTLSEDPLLRRANVRRLLALLRRAALRHGPEWMFEPNGPALRRRVERAFEALLALLYARGAFAGARASDAYRLELGEPPNSPQGMEAGRLVVDLKVAPSVPLEFLTVRMIRSGDRLAVEGA